MGFLDRLFGRAEPRPARQAAGLRSGASGATSADEQALERYRYMLRTAPPDQIERAHEEAFAQLTPEQRRLVLQELSTNLPEHERSLAQDDPRSLARLA